MQCTPSPPVSCHVVLSDGRECRVAFTCADRTDGDGNACKCARAVGRNDCASCE